MVTAGSYFVFAERVVDTDDWSFGIIGEAGEVNTFAQAFPSSEASTD